MSDAGLSRPRPIGRSLWESRNSHRARFYDALGFILPGGLFVTGTSRTFASLADEPGVASARADRDLLHHFDAGQQYVDEVASVHGDKLVEWLRS